MAGRAYVTSERRSRQAKALRPEGLPFFESARDNDKICLVLIKIGGDRRPTWGKLKAKRKML